VDNRIAVHRHLNSGLGRLAARQGAVMTNPKRTVVRISSASDAICAISHLLGFRPRQSIVVVCLHGARSRLGLVMRFDIELDGDLMAVAANVEHRVGRENPDGVLVAVFSDAAPAAARLPHRDIVEAIGRAVGDLVVDAVLVVAERWWSYACDDASCCPAEGNVVDRSSPGATAMAAAYALEGQAVMASREAVVETISYQGTDADMAAMADLIEAALIRSSPQPRVVRRQAVRELLTRLCTSSQDPRTAVPPTDAAELVALCEDVVVRDEILVRARKPRRRKVILRVLTHVARITPPPYDAAVCATLAFVAYAGGEGVITNVALDRALATDPRYSLAQLTLDALERQVPPWVLQEVMDGAARDLAEDSAAG
jgi:hypothetical protein